MSVIDKKFSSDLYQITWRVEEKNSGLRLDQFLMLFLETWSRELIKKKIKSGGISIAGRPGKPRPNTKVHYREHVTMKTRREELLEIEDEYWNGEKISLQWEPEKIAENQDFLVCSKPAFMSTHPTGRHLFHCATVYYESLYQHPVHSIHRLDRETSGVLLLAKNPKAATELTDNFENDRVQKCYFFISKMSNGDIEKEKFEVNLRLGPEGEGLKRVVIKSWPQDSQQGKSAKTFFHILHKTENGHVLGLAFPQTGRQHQIRVHAAQSGLPLIGDKLYFGDYPLFQRFKDRRETNEDYQKMLLPRHALHAVALKFPYHNKEHTYISNVAQDLAQWIKDHLGLNMSDVEKKIQNGVEDYFSKTSFK